MKLLLLLVTLITGNVSGHIQSADRYEGEVRISNQARRFVVVFSSVLKVDGRVVTYRQFWNAAKPHRNAAIKAHRYGPFWVVDAINIKE